MANNDIDSWVDDIMADVKRNENSNRILYDEDYGWDEFWPNEYRYYDSYQESVEDW